MSEHVHIKCLTLWQPWASAIALKLKTMETRSWGTRYRGLLGIHAGKGWDEDAASFLGQRVLDHAREHKGEIIAVCELANVEPCPTRSRWNQAQYQHLCLSRYWEPGKHLWRLRDIREIEPVPVTGSRGLWNWSGEIRVC